MAPIHKPKPVLRPTFLRQWREYRGLNQEQAASEFNMDRSNLSRIERGEVPYSQTLLEAAARLYRCEPPDLLWVNPLTEPDEVALMRLLRRSSSEDKAAIIGYAEGKIGPLKR